jgi:hypothetical protein
MFIGGLNWETTDGEFRSTLWVFYIVLTTSQNPSEPISLSLARLLNALSCVMVPPVDREALDS